MALQPTKPAAPGVKAPFPGFIRPCEPSKVTLPPSGPLWVHEIKHDGYRLIVRRDGLRVRCFTRNGHDWACGTGTISENRANAEPRLRC